MAYAVNSTKSGVTNLVDLINFSNPTAVQITPNQVEFADLIFEDSIPNSTNTKVTIKAIDGEGFINGPFAENGFSLWYNRVGLNTGVLDFTDEFPITVTTTWAQLRTQVATANNIVYDDVHIFEQALALDTDAISATLPPEDGGEGNTQVFNFIPSGNIVESNWVSVSYVYNNTQAVVTGNWVATDAPLDEVIAIRVLDGFVPAS